MSTKGASNRYGNSNGANHRGAPSEHINYAWAKGFNKNSLKKHFEEHGRSMGFDSMISYEQHAITFANTVDRKNCVSFIDVNTRSTYKYNKVTNEFAIITRDGYVVTYYKPANGIGYYYQQVAKHGKGGNR